MKNFWSKIKKPIYILAPMAGITDSAFRQMCKKYGAHVLYSEMASANALVYSPEKTLEMLKFEKKERPYVVQLFGSKPENFKKAVQVIEKEIMPDGIDINFGCPVPKIAKQKAGAELFKDKKLSREVIMATIESTTLPVSIKTRAKVGEIGLLEWLDNINDLDIKALMIHGRTFKQGFNGPVDMNIIKDARKHFKGIIIANGGVKDYDSAQELINKSQADGIGIGHGAMGCPWVFKAIRTGQDVNREIRPIFREAIKHAKLINKIKGEQGIIEMRKHLCWYVQGLSGAKKLRSKLIKINNISDIEKIFKDAI